LLSGRRRHYDRFPPLLLDQFLKDCGAVADKEFPGFRFGEQEDRQRIRLHLSGIDDDPHHPLGRPGTCLPLGDPVEHNVLSTRGKINGIVVTPRSRLPIIKRLRVAVRFSTTAGDNNKPSLVLNHTKKPTSGQASGNRPWQLPFPMK